MSCTLTQRGEGKVRHVKKGDMTVQRREEEERVRAHGGGRGGRVSG